MEDVRGYTLPTTDDKELLKEQYIVTDSVENGGIAIPVTHFADKDDLDKKFVTIRYNCGVENTTYDEAAAAYYSNKNGVRLMTYIADEKVFVFNAIAEEDSYIKFSGVYKGSLYEFKVTASGWSVTSKQLASSADVNAVKDEFTFGNNVSAESFKDAFNKGKSMVYLYVEQGGRYERTRRLPLVKHYQASGDTFAQLTFACVDDETEYKIVIQYSSSTPLELRFGEITSYAIKDAADTLASQVQGKLSAVTHDATLEGDGTEANPLKVIGGGGSSTIFSVDGEKLLIQNNVRVEQELLIV